MLTAQIEELLRKIKSGVYDPSDAEFLENASSLALLGELNSEFPLCFQERRLGDKWEIGLAHSLRHEVGSFSPRDAFFPVFLLVPVFRRCLFLSGQGDTVTGVALANRLSVRPIWKPDRGLALTTGRGFKLDKAPDGWSLKSVEKRAVQLGQDFLKKRGWRFDTLRFLPSATGA
jgi:hypothetical protein